MEACAPRGKCNSALMSFKHGGSPGEIRTPVDGFLLLKDPEPVIHVRGLTHFDR